MADHFWLSEVQWAAIEPHIPKIYTGKRRVDDRRMISGIVHRLREGGRWRALPEAYGPYDGVQPLQLLEQARAVAIDLRRARRER